MQGITSPGLREKLLSRKLVVPSGCWEYQGSLTTGGYGQIRISGIPRGVHRVAGILFNGWDWNSPLRTLHRCDNRPCFNPEHLFQGTQGDNLRDMVEKGRHGTKGTHKVLCPQGHEKEYYAYAKRWTCFECGRIRARDYKRRHSAQIART